MGERYLRLDHKHYTLSPIYLEIMLKNSLIYGLFQHELRTPHSRYNLRASICSYQRTQLMVLIIPSAKAPFWGKVQHAHGMLKIVAFLSQRALLAALPPRRGTSTQALCTFGNVLCMTMSAKMRCFVVLRMNIRSY